MKPNKFPQTEPEAFIKSALASLEDMMEQVKQGAFHWEDAEPPPPAEGYQGINSQWTVMATRWFKDGKVGYYGMAIGKPASGSVAIIKLPDECCALCFAAGHRAVLSRN